jgi:hypothetical protein
MLDSERRLYEVMLGYARLLTKEIDESQMDAQPCAAMNTPRWILGHLALCTDYALTLLGKPTRLPGDWHARFGPGSSVPKAGETGVPTKLELIGALAAGHAAASAAAESATPEQLAPKHSVEIKFVRELFPTIGELVAHLFTTHEAIHLGQLSAWRRAMGMPGVLVL